MRRLSLWASLLVLALAALPATALGAANHPFLSKITNAPTGFEDACGVAFNPGGSLYVSDYYRDAVVGSPGIAAEDPGDGPCKLAFDPAGDLYLNNWHRNVVKYSEPFGAGEVIDAEQPTGLAVDPATNDLYVAHRTYVAEYEAPVQEGDPPVKTIGLDTSAEYFGVAISDFPAAAGDLYLPDAATDTVKVFDPAGALVEEISGAATPQGAFKYLTDSEVAVDNSPTSPSYGHVFVLDAIGHGSRIEPPQAVLDEFNAQGAYRGQITGFTDAEPSGIAFQEGTHNVYVTNGNSEGSAVFVYGPTAPARTLKVAKAGTGGGTVSSNPAGISCGGACAAEFDEGQTLTLFASPDAHSVFTGWSVTEPGAEPCPGLGSCTMLMTAGREVTASFEEPTQETLTVSDSGPGTLISEPAGISCPGTCSEHFNQGRIVTLTATAAASNHLAAWGGGCAGTPLSEPCKVTMSAAMAVEAEFSANPQSAASGVGSAAAEIGSPPAPPPAAFTLAAKGSALTATVPAAGTLSVTGRGLKPATTHPAQAGTVTLPLMLSARGTRALHRARRHRLAVKVRVAFTPSAGPGVLASKAVTFGAADVRRWCTAKPARACF
jgi:DNA-binding beta-propeller fold protein YncE